MKLDISTIKNVKGAALEAEVLEEIGPLTACGEEVAPLGPVHVKVKATNVGKGIWVEGKALANIPLTCNRCMEPFILPLRTSFEGEYVKLPGAGRDHEGKQGVQGSAREAGEELYGFVGDEIDLQPQVRESLILALPIKALCKEDCKGLCPVCGKNLNEGPCECAPRAPDLRMAPLSRLINRGSEDGEPKG